MPKPGDLSGIPSSRYKKLPAPAPPDNTGDLIDVKCSWPLPWLIYTAGSLFKISLGFIAPMNFISSVLIEEILPPTFKIVNLPLMLLQQFHQ